MEENICNIKREINHGKEKVRSNSLRYDLREIQAMKFCTLTKGVYNLTLNFLIAKLNMEITIIHKIHIVKDIRQVIPLKRKTDILV